MSATPREIEAIFHEVADLPAGERAAALDRLCSGDHSLRARVESLLAADGAATVGILKSSPLDTASIAEKPGDVIDRYRLVERLGEGGFGVVYRAEQREPVQRDVALKIIKLGMDTRRVVHRFEAERQTLAMLDHPGIARVIDAGSTSTGRPYFAMDLVRGAPITEFADERRLDTEARLHLFLQVCDAVQHAHQKGVIHRDLKPSNILVSEIDGAPLPRVIDFGIARAIDHRRLADHTFTEQGQIIGTPEYMSPEQAAGEDIDTRADIYALGVILYELLTGGLPCDSASLRSGELAKIRQLILTHQPPKPSTRAVSASDTAAAQARHADDQRALARRLRGDLDWITMKALEKNRLRRYDSASELAADIRRHLRREPVLAGPPSRVYRAQRFIARNRLPVAAASVVALALIAGAVASTVGFVRATRAEADARDDAARALAAEVEARTQTARAVAVRDFLAEMLRSADPANALGREFTVREILDQASSRIDDQLAANPVVAADIHAVIADTYRSLDLFEKATPHVESAVDLRRNALGADHPDTLDAIHDRGALLEDLGRFEEAETVLRDALEHRARVHGAHSHEASETMSRLANVLMRRGRTDDAILLLEDSLAIRRELLDPPHASIAGALDALGRAYDARARDVEAEPLFREALEMRAATHGEHHPFTASTANNLASVLHDMRRFEEAEALYRRAIEIQRAVYKGDHTSIARTLNNLASLLQDQGDYDAAEPLFLESLDMRRRLYPPDHAVVVNAVNNLAVIRFLKKDYEGAEAIFREVADMRQRSFGADHPEYGRALSSLAATLNQLNRYEEALPLLDQALAILEASIGSSHPALSPVLHNCGEVRLRLDRQAEAVSFFRRAIDLHIASPAGAGSPNALQTWFALADCHAFLGDDDDARAVLAEATPLMLAYSGKAGIAHRSIANTADLAARLGDEETADALRRRLEELNATEVAPAR